MMPHEDNGKMSLWPKGVIPYKIDLGVMSAADEYKKIMAMIEYKSCIRYIPYDKTASQSLGLGHEAFLQFVKASGCWAVHAGNVLTSRGRGISCCDNGACLHELGHALGLYHEQENPKGNDWIRFNPENLWPKHRGMYQQQGSTKNVDQTFPHDLSSIMHYSQWAGNGMGPSMTILFPELNFSDEYYYMFMEIAKSYKCAEKDACKDFPLTCENDGYQTVVHGKCACRCVPGLDPNTGCTTILKKHGTTDWPKGPYALPKPATGCPGGPFNDGQMTLNGRDGKTMATSNICARTLDDDVFTTEEEGKFNWPIGQFCVYKWGEKCPSGFHPGAIGYKDKEDNTPLEEFCCQYKGLERDEVSFPTDKPFTLFRSSNKCQQVTGMRVKSVDYSIDSKDSNNKFKVDGRISHSIKNGGQTLVLHLCQYMAPDKDCGAVITLDKNVPKSMGSFSSDGRSDLECTWLIKGEHEDGTLVLDFGKFDVKGDDEVEVRHARIGQRGLRYSGEKIGHSIRTITSMALIRFYTYGTGTSSFEVNIKWIPNDDLCYDVHDKGYTYAGKVNYTRIFEPCLPWAQATHCPHHPLNERDALANLEANYCRNPDHSFRPWCYTATDGCQRNYCDVCKLESPQDKRNDCQMLNDKGFCTENAAVALENCAKTCMSQFPDDGPIQRYTKTQCPPPTVPSYGEQLNDTKDKYMLGDTVTFKCKGTNDNNTVDTTCLTTGDWSPVYSTCPNCVALYGSESVFNKACYVLVDKLVPFAQAQAECKTRGGHIAFSKSPAENKFINSIRQGQWIWLGATDTDKEGDFVWEDGTKVDWNNWKPKQPDNWNQNEDCASMIDYTQWNDANCNSNLKVVCSIPGGEVRCEDLLQCPELLNRIPTMCTDFPEFAVNLCPLTCGLCGPKSPGCPVQLTKPDVITTTSDAIVPVGGHATYSCDKFKFPVKGDATRGCQFSGELTGEPLECGDCPLGFTQANGSCYGLITDKSLTFSKAQELCLKVGGIVATPRNKDENDLISSTGWDGMIWISDMVANPEWNNWANGEPNSQGSQLRCSAMTENKDWVKVKCDTSNIWTVCTIPKSNSNMCYDLRNKGATYNGKMNYTSSFQACLPWAEVSQCNYNAFKEGMEKYNLEGNYCRNPDGAQAPWCYHNHICDWAYCSVCQSDDPVDKVDDCQKKRDQGFCTADAIEAAKSCPLTCKDQLPSAGVAKNYLEVVCEAPIAPSDGDIVGPTKPQYKLGDVVNFRCKRNKFVVSSTCLTSGDWSTVGLACTECPWGFKEFDKTETCYGVVPDKIQTALEAQEECQKIGGFLPRPKTLHENNFINDLLPNNMIWIDAKWNLDGGGYRWTDGTLLEWTNWDDKQPTNWNGCAYSKKNVRWSNTLCDARAEALRTVCAVPKLDRIYASTEFNNSSYVFIDKTVTFDQAQAECKQMSGHLASPKSLAESKAIASTMRKDRIIWLGATDTDKEGNFVWEDGSPVDWNSWSAGEPNDYKKNEDCVMMYKDTVWNDIFCGYKHSIACTIPGKEKFKCEDFLPAECPSMFNAKPTMCRDYPEYSKRLCAKTCGVCGADGVRCPVPRTNPDLTVSATSDDIPIGDVATFDCAKYKYYSGGDRLRVCQLDGTLTGMELHCVDRPPGSIEFNNSSYLFVDKPVTFSQAQTECKKLYGYVASPKSIAENDVIASLRSRDVWLGATDTDTEGHFMWEDGTKVEWNNWNSGEPNNFYNNEDCVVMRGDKLWNDIGCGFQNRFVCTIPRKEIQTCYDIEDKGVSYSGKVKETEGSEPCVLWTEATNCPHHPFQKGDEMDNLEANYCRNPDDSFRPWCYTDAKTCTKKYCDVCNTPPTKKDIVSDSFNGASYVFVNKPTTFDQAQNKCKTLNGHLAAPESQLESDFVDALRRGESIWLGATDRENEGDFVWEDGTKVVWKNWDNVQPDNFNDNEHCVVMRPSKKWNDIHCTDHYALVCTIPELFYTEIACKPPTAPPDGELIGDTKRGYKLGDVVSFQCKGNHHQVVKSRCLTSGDWSPVGRVCTDCIDEYGHEFSNSCYKFVDKFVTHAQAQAACRDLDGYVASSKSLAENNFIVSIVEGQWVWLGATDKVFEREFVWDDGTSMDWTNWLSGQPDNYYNDDCIYMGKDNKWVDVVCEDKYRYVCATPRVENIPCKDVLEHQCPDLLTNKPTMCKDFPQFAMDFCAHTCSRCGINYSNLNLSSCPVDYKDSSYVYIDKPATWGRAQTECKRLHGKMASPKNLAENDFVDSVRKGMSIWLGASDLAKEGDFVWEDGTKLDWTNWGAANPDDYGKNEDCSSMRPDKTWNDLPCTYQLRIVCTIPGVFCCPVQTSDPGVTVTTSSAAIPIGDAVSYSCQGNQDAVTGNRVRACLPNGQLTGSPLQCPG